MCKVYDERFKDTHPADNPSDIRDQGWAVAVHNDYRLVGVPHTFWLFTRGDSCVKGEGKTDSEALDDVRNKLKMRCTSYRDKPMMQHPEYGSMRPAASVLRDLLNCPRDFMPKTQIAAAAIIIEDQENAIVSLRCALACATCLFKSTPDDPCPYLKQCRYGAPATYNEVGENFWSGVDSLLP